MNRVGSVFPKFLPHLFCKRFFASGPTDARQNVLVVIVDFNGEQQLHVNGRYSELLGRSPDFPFPGNVKPVAEVQQQKLAAQMSTKRGDDSPGAVMPLHKIVEPSFVVADDRTANPRALKHRQMWQMGDDGGTTAKCEWMVTGVDSIRMLWQEVNAMFGKRFLAGSEITVISLCANIAAPQKKTAQDKNADDKRTVFRVARRDLIVPSYEFVRLADALCSELRAAGFWADFVDPRNGRPYRRRKQRRPAEPSLGHQSLVLEWDPQNTFNGLHISSTDAATAGDEDGSACKIIERAEWEKMDFCGQLFTDCPPNSEEMQKILSTFEAANKINGKADENGGDGRGAGDLFE